MTLPTGQMLCDVIDATWPPAEKATLANITCRRGLGGGSRVSAATADGSLPPDQLAAAEALMRSWGQTPQFMIRPGDTALDAVLQSAGYHIQDPTCLYAAPIEALTATKVPPVTSFQVWPPLQTQRNIWMTGGIGAARLAIMARADCRKASFLGRVNDRPAGTVYAGLHGSIAMLHALEILPQDRRQGLAANLTRAVAVWGQKHRATHLALATTADNAAANGLYTSLGMSVVGHYHYLIKPDPDT